MGFGGAGSFDDIGKPKDRLYEKAKRYQDTVSNLIIAIYAQGDWRLYPFMDEVACSGQSAYTVYVNKDPDTKSLSSERLSGRPQKMDVGSGSTRSGPSE